MEQIERPTAHLATRRGLAAYDPREVAAWRAAHGVSQDALAQHLKFKQPYLVRLESDKYGPLEAKNGDRILLGVESVVRLRERVAADGLARLKEIRAAKGMKRAPR